jgi:nucleotide-binding universal stress UspA family protein
MFDPILFATDFSPASYPASVYATTLAEHFHSVLTLLHVFLPSQAAEEAEARDGVVSEQRRILRQELDLATHALTPKDGKGSSLLLEGDPSRVLPKKANEFPNGMLVLGTHGGNFLEHRLIGSVAGDALQRSTIPVLTVGPHVATVGNVLPFQRIFLAADALPVAANAEILATALAQSFSSLLTVGMLGDRDQDNYDLLVIGIKTNSRSMFRIIAESLCPVLTLTDVIAHP